MGIMDELNAVDEKLKTDLEQKRLEIEQTDEEQNPSKITLQSIKNAIRRVLGKGER